MIRDAELEDAKTIERILRDMWHETRYSRFKYNGEKILDLIFKLITTPRGIAIVSDNDGIDGVFLGVIGEQFFADGLQSSDFIQYVSSDSRGKGIGKSLINEYIKQAKERGVDDICIGSSSGINVERIGKMYEKLGFSMIGTTHALEV